MKNIFYILFLFVVFSCSTPETKTTDIQDESLLIINHEEIIRLTSLEREVLQITSKKDTLKVISVGHIHSLMEFSDLREEFYGKIKSEKPDLVVFTGDHVFYNNQSEWDSLLAIFNDFPFPYFITPGNHDIGSYSHEEAGITNRRDTAIQRYLHNARTRYKKVEWKNYNIVLLNTNDRLSQILNFKNQLDLNNKTNILFSHHNLFIEKERNDSIATSWTGTWYERKQLRDSLKEFTYFINGDWNLKFGMGRKDENKISYSVGNRMKGDPLFYTVFELTSDTLNAYPKHLDIDSTHKWYQN